MSSDLHTLEPFPLFVDSKAPSPYDHFSKMGVVGLLSPASVSQLRKQHASVSNKVTNYLQTRYYQYELTFGLYVMTYNEKLVLNSIVLTIFTALLCGLYAGFQPFVVRSICQLIYYLNGSLAGVEDICTGTTCS